MLVSKKNKKYYNVNTRLLGGLKKTILSILISTLLSALFYKIIKCIPNINNIEESSKILFILLLFPIYKLLTNNVKKINIFFLGIWSVFLDFTALKEADLGYFSINEDIKNIEDVRDSNKILKSKIIFTIICFGIISSILLLYLLNFSHKAIMISMILLFIFTLLIPYFVLLIYTKVSFENTLKEKIIIGCFIVLIILILLIIYYFKINKTIISYVSGFLLIIIFLIALLKYILKK